MENQKRIDADIFLQQQEPSRHLDYEKEFGFYKAIASGNLDEVKRRHAAYAASDGYPTSDDRQGILSADPLQNLKYHFVILAAMISRYCADSGLPRELAYSMSDVYIRRVDICKRKEEVNRLQTEMILRYTKVMQENRNKGIYSKQIVKCVDYIHANLQQDLHLETLAEYLDMNPTYLSRLFKKEMKIPISTYIKNERLKNAAQLLQYSDYTISEISESMNFSSQSHFTSSFQKLFGITPKHYRDSCRQAQHPYTP